jgi:hypothetical protein
MFVVNTIHQDNVRRWKGKVAGVEKKKAAIKIRTRRCQVMARIYTPTTDDFSTS